MKFSILAGMAMMTAPIAANAVPFAGHGAQDTPTSTAPTGMVPQTAPTTPATPPAPVDPSTTQTSPAPVTPASPPVTSDQNPQTAAPAQPAATGNQIATLVDQRFPTYDKDGNGALSKTEFTDWMLELRKASDPSVKPGDPATKAWMTQAFTQADTDKSGSVSKDEMTRFLTQAQKAS